MDAAIVPPPPRRSPRRLGGRPSPPPNLFLLAAYGGRRRRRRSSVRRRRPVAEPKPAQLVASPSPLSLSPASLPLTSNLAVAAGPKRVAAGHRGQIRALPHRIWAPKGRIWPSLAAFVGCRRGAPPLRGSSGRRGCLAGLAPRRSPAPPPRLPCRVSGVLPRLRVTAARSGPRGRAAGMGRGRRRSSRSARSRGLAAGAWALGWPSASASPHPWPALRLLLALLRLPLPGVRPSSWGSESALPRGRRWGRSLLLLGSQGPSPPAPSGRGTSHPLVLRLGVETCPRCSRWPCGRGCRSALWPRRNLLGRPSALGWKGAVAKALDPLADR
ncbi:hypothetical protein PVAP13_3NG175184 [Panicum virgatum]|uniref:Uncharacterized protein n=1 Tax=Panicum virgatum TaxID=38727 RepID=A0A8T0UEH9_PANVG|nr:hypothetical protein PVAP13_3NG175184 [Panicum virgatum]